MLVENVLSLYKQKNKISILDIGIGSGSILLSILKENKIYGIGIDISKKCLITSKINATNLGVNLDWNYINQMLTNSI